MKIAINLAGAAAPSVPAPEAPVPSPVTTATGIVVKRERDGELDHETLEPINAKRPKQESPPLVTVKPEPESSDDDAPMEVHPSKPWLTDAFDLLDIMDSHDELGFFRGKTGPQEASVPLVRAQLRKGKYDSFDHFLASLKSVYKSAERYGADAYKQASKLLESLDRMVQSLCSSVADVKQETDQMSASGIEDDASVSDGDASAVNEEEYNEQLKNEIEGVSDDEEEELPRIRSCSVFRDKYENHADHAQRPFWVCLMVRFFCFLWVGSPLLLFFTSLPTLHHAHEIRNSDS
jgi:hypothetical protein